MKKIFEVYFGNVYMIDYDCDYSYDCKSAGCDSICRCGKIHNIIINSINCDLSNVSISEQYSDKRGAKRRKNYSQTRIEKYCVDRLLRIYKTYDKSLYRLIVEGGYYGEEISGFKFEKQDELVSSIVKLLNFDNDLDKIKFTLSEEYSYILNTINNSKSIDVITIKLESVIMNEEYIQRLKKNLMQFGDYNFEPNIPVGLVRREGGDFILIDGYHRFISLKNKNVEKASYLVIE
jgi:hypothetical protein